MWVSARQMLYVPSVTMNGGIDRPTTRPPLTRPTIIHVAIPSRIASRGGTPELTASLVITIEPSAIAVPQDRSMPAVRMISVWPMASVPITITCWMMSEKFSGWRNRSDCVVKKMHARASASSGPSCATRSPEIFGIVLPPPPPSDVGGADWPPASDPGPAGGVCGCVMGVPFAGPRGGGRPAGAGPPPFALAPAVRLAEVHVLGGDALDRLIRDQ